MNGSSRDSQFPGKGVEDETPAPLADHVCVTRPSNGETRSRRSGLYAAVKVVVHSSWFERACRYLLALVFLFAAVSKISNIPAFITQLAIHSPFSLTVVRNVGSFLPWLELTCALCLLLSVCRRESAAILAALLVAFIGYNLLTPAGMDCGCFLLPRTVDRQTFNSLSVPRNLLLLACAIRVGLRKTYDVATS